MRSNTTAGDELYRLWRRHAQAAFPERLRDQRVAGIDLVALNTEVAHCVEVWRTGSGRLDDDRRSELAHAIERLDVVLPLLPSRLESIYFTRLYRVAVGINAD